MTDREPSTEGSPAPRRRVDVALASAAHAVVLGGGAAVLSFRSGSPIAVALAVTAVLHLATAATALLPRPRAFARCFRAAAMTSLALFAVLTFLFASSALYVRSLYQGVGPLVAAALVVVWGLLVLLTVPFGLWGLLSTRRESRGRSNRAGPTALTAAVVVVLSALWVARSAKARPVAQLSDDERRRVLLSALAPPSTTGGAAPGASPSLFTDRAAACEASPDGPALTVLATYPAADGPRAACVQAADAAALGTALRDALRARSAAAPVKLDWITAVHPLDATTPLLDALKLRPELDGVCAYGRCLAPWQLIAIDAFTQHRPVAAVRDMSFGVSVQRIRSILGGGKSIDGLLRIETASYVWNGEGLHALRGVHEPRRPLTSAALDRATRLAEAHIAAAQEDDGTFRYVLDPFSGKADTAQLNLRRHAGTTLALCESPADRARIALVVERALAVLSNLERTSGPLSALAVDENLTKVGDTALGLAAFVGCRPLVGDGHDALIGRLARSLLAAMRANGSFAPELDLHAGTPRGDGEVMYTAGQAMLALVAFEALLGEAKSPTFPAPPVVREAVERGMNFYSRDYWPWPLSDFFYLEENWHCLAARAALKRHPHDAYERFCLDYVSFKARLILNERDADPALRGAYGLGNVFPPHNTATAGYGEALAAALAVAGARGWPSESHRERLEEVLGFLVSVQWNDVNCFACSRDHVVTGGFSEHFASPSIRIDYVQHALSAMRHGGEVLGLSKQGAPSAPPGH